MFKIKNKDSRAMTSFCSKVDEMRFVTWAPSKHFPAQIQQIGTLQ